MLSKALKVLLIINYIIFCWVIREFSQGWTDSLGMCDVMQVGSLELL